MAENMSYCKEQASAKGFFKREKKLNRKIFKSKQDIS